MTGPFQALSSRRPEEANARMRPLSRLPVFLSLEGKRGGVAAARLPATWKAELLSAAGARVEVFCEEPGDELRTLAGRAAPRAPFDHRPGLAAGRFRRCRRGDRRDDRRRRGRALLRRAARRAGVPVNVIDKPRLAISSFGAVVNRSPLVIGISTDGAAPVFAQAIRAKIEGLLPRGFARWAEAARRWRALVQATDLSARARRRVLAAVRGDRAMSNPERDPARRAISMISSPIHPLAPRGYRPGDAGRRRPRQPRAADAARGARAACRPTSSCSTTWWRPTSSTPRREAKKMLVGKTGHRPSCKQEEINSAHGLPRHDPASMWCASKAAIP